MNLEIMGKSMSRAEYKRFVMEIEADLIAIIKVMCAYGEGDYEDFLQYVKKEARKHALTKRS